MLKEINQTPSGESFASDSFASDGFTGDHYGAGEEKPPLVLDGDTPFEEALALSLKTNRIDIRFAKFGDGRGFSLAAMLRERGFTGDLRAIGDILPDQAGYLRRAGFNFTAPDQQPQSLRWQRPDISLPYQFSTGANDNVIARRTRAARQKQIDALNARCIDASPEEIFKIAVETFAGRIAMLSSFGTEAAVGLALLAKTAPSTPILFLDTKRHFPETLAYRDTLIAKLGLKDVRVLEPELAAAEREDPKGVLYETNPDACCDLRKVRPLGKALNGFDVLITGRKRAHGDMRAELLPFDFDGTQIRVNPLATVTPKMVAQLFKTLDLPPHPLTSLGYPSVGCWPCTAATGEAGGRSGRWAGQARTECGIFNAPSAKDPARHSTRLI